MVHPRRPGEVAADPRAEATETGSQQRRRQATLGYEERPRTEDAPAQPVAPPAPTDRRLTVHRYPEAPMAIEEVHTALARAMATFGESERATVFELLRTRRYSSAVATAEAVVRAQPRNLTVAKAAALVRHFASLRAESDLGGRHVRARWARGGSAALLPAAFAALGPFLDGNAALDAVLRRTGLDRLEVLSLLGELARRRHLDLFVPETVPGVSTLLPRVAPTVPAIPAAAAPVEAEALVRVVIETDPPGCDLRLDGVWLDAATGEREVMRSSGRHLLEVSRPGYRPRTVRFLAEAGVRIFIGLTEA